MVAAKPRTRPAECGAGPTASVPLRLADGGQVGGSDCGAVNAAVRSATSGRTAGRRSPIRPRPAPVERHEQVEPHTFPRLRVSSPSPTPVRGTDPGGAKAAARVLLLPRAGYGPAAARPAARGGQDLYPSARRRGAGRVPDRLEDLRPEDLARGRGDLDAPGDREGAATSSLLHATRPRQPSTASSAMPSAWQVPRRRASSETTLRRRSNT